MFPRNKLHNFATVKQYQMQLSNVKFCVKIRSGCSEIGEQLCGIHFPHPVDILPRCRAWHPVARIYRVMEQIPLYTVTAC